MAEESLRALRDVSLHLSPLPLLVTDPFAKAADREHSLEHSDLTPLQKRPVEQHRKSHQDRDVNASIDPFEEPGGRKLPFRKNESRSSGSMTATTDPASTPWAAVAIATGTTKRIGN
jgi:hypothetical protein